MTNWTAKLLSPAAPGVPFRQQLELLFEQQRATWDLFRTGEAGLSVITTKRLTIDGNDVVVQANPGRSISTNAKVDPQSVAQRPCFLCPDRLPPQERGIAFGNYVILPNPYPILDRHITIARHRHEPQRLEGRIEDLCALAEALGPDLLVLYNGPKCGASAPDHMHFQACSSSGVPLFDQIPAGLSTTRVIPLSLCGRNLLACSFDTISDAQMSLQSILTSLEAIIDAVGEPMINIIARYQNGRFSICLFPRAKHRSACYFAEPSQRLSISPAAIEMAGIIVVADSSHFDRVDEKAVRSMYDEVTLDTTLFSRLSEAAT